MSTTTATPPVTIALDPAQWPDEPALLKAMLIEVLAALRDSRRESEQLRNRLDQLLRRLYGTRSERLDPNQLLLFPDLGTAPETPSAAETEAPSAPSGSGQRRRGHGRQTLPRHLPRERRVYELSAAERVCPCCGQERQVIGQERSEQLDYVPASLQVIEHIRLTYACHRCAGTAPPEATPVPALPLSPPPAKEVGADTSSAPPVVPATVSPIRTAAKPAPPLARALAAPGLLAYVIVSKFGDHLPLYRLERIFARQGMSLARSTMGDWLAACAELLQPLYQRLVQEVLQSWVIQTDDTPVRVLHDDRDRTRQGRVWDYWGDAYHPYVVYAYTPNREQTGPQQFLGDFRGYLQADAYTGYDALFATGRILEVGCWAHARRKFYDIRLTDPERSLYALGVIRQLYQVEKQVDEQIAARGLSQEAGWWLRLQLRHEQATPRLTSFRHWLEEQRAVVLPKSPLMEAVGYALNQWAALVRYTTQGYLAIDNNAAERALRAVAVGRKNYLFFGSDGGGTTAAVLYTFVQSCQRLGIEPWRYLRDVLERLPSWPAERLPELLPDRWAQAQRAATTGPPAPDPSASPEP